MLQSRKIDIVKERLNRINNIVVKLRFPKSVTKKIKRIEIKLRTTLEKFKFQNIRYQPYKLFAEKHAELQRMNFKLNADFCAYISTIPINIDDCYIKKFDAPNLLKKNFDIIKNTDTSWSFGISYKNHYIPTYSDIFSLLKIRRPPNLILVYDKLYHFKGSTNKTLILYQNHIECYTGQQVFDMPMDEAVFSYCSIMAAAIGCQPDD